jgi:two-component system, sensor histidine kinase and response regulator
VLGMTDLLESSNPTAEQREYLEVIHESADSLLSMISKILEFAGKTKQVSEAELETLSIAELVAEEIQTARVAADRKGLMLRLTNRLKDRILYRADAGKLRLAVQALLDNAVKFTNKGEVVVTIVSRGRSPRAEFLAISVEDTGIGIPPHLHEAIFEAFNQADISNSRSFGGAGIGLSLAREAVRSLGGEIVVKSTDGRGSTFTIEVALAREGISQAELPPVPVEAID